jgi:hypothetical protein
MNLEIGSWEEITRLDSKTDHRKREGHIHGDFHIMIESSSPGMWPSLWLGAVTGKPI